MKLLVCGSRTIIDLKYIYECLDEILEKYPIITEIIEGEAPGVDRIAGTYAIKHGLKVKKMQANWIGYGKIAGFIRNKQMVDLCDMGIAIWNGKSNGTRHTIEFLKKQDKLIKIFLE
jgi:hypothetical protein